VLRNHNRHNFSVLTWRALYLSNLITSCRITRKTKLFVMSTTRCANAPSAARLFVQLSTRSRQTPILDVFLPQQTRSFRSFARAMPRIRPGTVPSPILHVNGSEAVARRAFSSTNPRRRTQAIYNPQNDDDGNEMLLEITPRAANVCPRLSQACVSLADRQHIAPLPDHGKRCQPESCSAHTG
jgi:hypothetical protein